MSKDKYQHINDKDLLERYWQTRDKNWLGILLQRYTLLLLGVCMKYLKDEENARDCVQQIFLKVIQELEKYRVDYFKSWLYMVAKNQCLTILRDGKNKFYTELNETIGSHSIELTVDTFEDESVPNEVMLNKALRELNKEQYECVNLFYLQKKTYQEVSAITGYSLLKVKSYIQNGKRNLKIIIEKKIKSEKLT